MIGLLVAIIACLSAMGFALLCSRKMLKDIDPAARIGLAGLMGLGFFGTILFFGGMASIETFSVALTIGGLLFGIVFLVQDLRQNKISISRPEGALLIFPLVIAFGLLMALAGVLAPSTAQDWDSLAYHLAVPKMWLEHGKIAPVSFIHQSNFPFAVDSLFLIGLKWGGQAGAKAFIWCFTLLGAIALFGLARQRYGQQAGWWAALVFSTVPIVLWQSGTAYIDVAHGLYAGLGIVFACLWLESDDSRHATLGGIFLGLACATKYTGLQTLAIAGLVALVGAILLKRGLKPVIVGAVAALVIAAPWYVKNVVWKGNPVFPFFYSKLGGKDWDQRRGDIYTIEQNTFGVGRETPPDGGLQLQRIGHSVIGLAYQPGRYVNPQQTVGGGDPMGAIGIAVIGALLLGMLAGQRERFEKATIVCILLSLAVWFVLTQQSRYIVTLAVPLALLAGQLTTRKGFAPLMSGLAGLQALASLYLLHGERFSNQMLVVTGKVTPEEYQARGIGFYSPAQAINQLGKNVKVALYDEVFGYFLDVPYYWANAGHSTEIPYDSMQSGDDYVDGMKAMGFTHVYMNLDPRIKNPAVVEALIACFQGRPFPADLKASLTADWQQKFNPLIADAVLSGKMTVAQGFGNAEHPRAVLLQLN